MTETVFIILLLVIFFMIGFTLRKRKTKRNASMHAEKGSIVAKAVVLSIEEATTTTAAQAKMKILVQVMPAKGRNFVIELKETLSVTELSGIRTGVTVSVKYNPANTKDVKLIKAA